MRELIAKKSLLWYGYMYINGEWKSVTGGCILKMIAVIKLNKWKKNNSSYKFELKRSVSKEDWEL